MKGRTGSRRTSARRTSIPRKSVPGSFAGMLARLGLASNQLKSARGRR